MHDGAPADETRRAIERLPELVNADPGFAFRARAMTLDFALASGPDRYYVSVRSGRVDEVVRGSQVLRSAALAFAAEPAVWLAHWRPLPSPGEHDLFALVKDQRLSIEGDTRVLIRHLQNFKDILAAPRALFGEA